MGGNDGKWTSVSTAVRAAAAAGLVQWVGCQGVYKSGKDGAPGVSSSAGRAGRFLLRRQPLPPAGNVAFSFGFVGFG